MQKCKYSGDKSDNYCVSCDGIKMMVEGVETSCTKCAGYEPGEEILDDVMNPPVEEDIPFEEEKKNDVPVPTPVQKPVTNKTKKTDKKSAEPKQTKTEVGNEAQDKPKVVERVQNETEETDGIKVVSLTYTSGCTINHNDTYYKFIAEEKWDLSNYKGDVQEAREMLWAQLNSEIDNQIAEVIK